MMGRKPELGLLAMLLFSLVPEWLKRSTCKYSEYSEGLIIRTVFCRNFPMVNGLFRPEGHEVEVVRC